MFPIQPKPFRGRKFEVQKPFPVDLTSTACGYFTGLDIEIFDNSLIDQIHESGCFGLNPKPRQMVSFNEKNEETSSDSRSLVLFPEEAFFLHQFFDFQVQDPFIGSLMSTEQLWISLSNLKDSFVECYVSYLYLKNKNWVIKPGIKFGCDFLAYKHGPQFNHASFAVIIKRNESHLPTLNYQTNERIAETTGKCLLYLEVYFPEEVEQSNYLENLDKFKMKELMVQRKDMPTSFNKVY